MRRIQSIALGFFLSSGVFGAGAFNYAEALQKSIYFYECQQSGSLPSWNRVMWRGPSCIHDGGSVEHDLTGGWYDAGDNVKFNFPMAYSVTMLAWGVKEYRDAYQSSGQLTAILNTIQFAARYLVKCHTAPNELYGQVGNGGTDHAFWGPAESVEYYMSRPAYKIDAANPGTDLAGETCAALAAASIVLRQTDPLYADTLLKHAKELYTFADTYRGKYSSSISDAQGYYNSWSGYNDELVWSALWLFMATNDNSYVSSAEANYSLLGTEPQSTIKSYKWTTSWDDKSYACYVLLSKLTGKQQYKDDAQRWLDFWSVGVNGAKIAYTPGGLAWLDTWGSCRYAANTAFCALIYSDYITDGGLKTRYHDFALSQINYMLGNNPTKRSFMVGFGNNPPTHPHHRTCTGFFPSQASDTAASKHVLYGALVGGPTKTDDYTDERNNYTTNEVACDYNAAFTGTLARLYKEYGGTPMANFPSPEVVDTELFVMASINAHGDRFTEIKATLSNKTAWPARGTSKLSFRYYVDVSEAIAAGISPSAIKVSKNYVQGKGVVSDLKVADQSKNLYYVLIDYSGDTLYPGTQDSYKREIQFRVSLPDNAAISGWNPNNDWSYLGLTNSTPIRSVRIPVYDDGKLVFGSASPIATGIMPNSKTESLQQRGNFWENSFSAQAYSLQGRAITAQPLRSINLQKRNTSQGVIIVQDRKTKTSIKQVISF